MRPILLLLMIAVVAFPLAVFAADDFSGLLDTGFAYNDVVGGEGGHADQYDARGAVLYTFDNPGLAVQLEGSDDWFASPGRIDHLWSAGGDAFWRDSKGTIGLSASYAGSDGAIKPLFETRTAIESYGFFGEYYVARSLTLQIKGGGTAGDAGSSSYYGGGGLTFYDSPDLAFHAEANFTSFVAGRDLTDIDSSLEYLPFGSVPVSLYAGYDWTNISGGGYVSTVFAGLKFRFGPGYALADDQRSGPIEWTGNAAPGVRLKF
jgi:hypothetical protein